MVWILPLNWHQRAFLPVPQPSENVDAVKRKNLPQGLHCRRTAKVRGFLEDCSHFLQRDFRPVCTRTWFFRRLSNATRAWASAFLPAAQMDALLLGHSWSANSLITTALIPSALPGYAELSSWCHLVAFPTECSVLPSPLWLAKGLQHLHCCDADPVIIVGYIQRIQFRF